MIQVSKVLSSSQGFVPYLPYGRSHPATSPGRGVLISATWGTHLEARIELLVGNQSWSSSAV